MIPYIQRKSDYCSHCGNPKMVQLRRYENGVWTMEKQCDMQEYRTLHLGEVIHDVWCSGCGLRYHPASI